MQTVSSSTNIIKEMNICFFSPIIEVLVCDKNFASNENESVAKMQKVSRVEIVTEENFKNTYLQLCNEELKNEWQKRFISEVCVYIFLPPEKRQVKKFDEFIHVITFVCCIDYVMASFLSREIHLVSVPQKSSVVLF